MNTESAKDEQRDYVAVQRLVRGLRAMAKWGIGPCGGGGCLDFYAQGRSEAEARMRKEIRRLLKEFNAANESSGGTARGASESI